MTTTSSRTVTEPCGRCNGTGIYSHYLGGCYGCNGTGTRTVTLAAVKARKTRAAKARVAVFAGREDWTVEDFIAGNDAEVAAGRAQAGSPESTLAWAIEVHARKEALMGRVAR
jgi:DnaJ-class molecular chaperone